MTFEELTALDKSLGEAANKILACRSACTNYGWRKLDNVYAYIREQSLAVGRQIDAYFAEVA